jgi:hypothetical protein
MPNPMILLGAIIATFLLAGLVKGVTGLALPTVGIGLRIPMKPAGYSDLKAATIPI